MNRLTILKAWTMRALPGIGIIFLVIVARLGGSLQVLEWLTLDYFLRYRPSEARDDRIVLVTINDADLRKLGNYPSLSTQDLAGIVSTLQRYQPRVIGINILNNPATPIDDANLYQALDQPKNVIVAEKVLPDQIPSLPQFPKKQIGFTDIYLDGDNRLRRMILGTPNPLDHKDYRLSLAIQLAEAYLTNLDSKPDFALNNGNRDPYAMRFSSTELPYITPNFGGYVGADAGGVQILLNFRHHRSSFSDISFSEIQSGNFHPNQLRDRIIILGITDRAIRPPISTRAVASSNGLSKQISGLEMQAHTVSQLISAVLDHRPLLNGWPDTWEYTWIFGWGILSIILCQITPSTKRKLLNISVASVGLLALSYGLLLWGWWVPFAPSLLTIFLTGIGYAALDRHDRGIRFRLDENQRILDEKRLIIEHTFDIIHNGPLQSLASILRRLRDREITLEALLPWLENLDRDIRAIGEHLQQATLNQEELLYLDSDLKLDLNPPIHELFYEVYRSTLDRDFSGFRTIKAKVREFEPIQQQLSLEQKRDLCRFLEEALCNVGKHAVNVTYLSATGCYHQGWYVLCIEDNGESNLLSTPGRGTDQAQRLAQKLKGRFERQPLAGKGVLCELTWPINPRKS